MDYCGKLITGTSMLQQEPKASALPDAIRVGVIPLVTFGEVTAVTDRFEVVRAWHEAVNASDADALVDLSRDDIEIGGPRGSTTGSATLRDWVGRAGIHLEPQRWFGDPDTLVVEQVATWRTAEGGVTEPDTIASSFQVEEGLVSRMVRYPSLVDALAATGLTVQDEMSKPAS